MTVENSASGGECVKFVLNLSFSDTNILLVYLINFYIVPLMDCKLPSKSLSI